MATVLTSTTTDEAGGTIVSTSTQDTGSFVIENEHNPAINPEEPEFVGAYSKVTLNNEGLTVEGHDEYGVPFVSGIAFGNLGEIMILRQANGSAPSIANGISTAFAPENFLNGCTPKIGYEAPGYEIGSDGRVHLFGVITIPLSTFSNPIPNDYLELYMVALPDALIPSKTRMFSAQVDGNGSKSAELVINLAGNIGIRNTGSTKPPTYVSLEGISFQPNPFD